MRLTKSESFLLNVIGWTLFAVFVALSILNAPYDIADIVWGLSLMVFGVGIGAEAKYG